MPTTTMTGVTEVLWLGLLLGVGSALAVGPIFVVIVQQAATSGFAASFRVILGSATADLVLLLPALAFTWVIRSVEQGALWVGPSGRCSCAGWPGRRPGTPSPCGASTGGWSPTAAGRSGRG